MHFRLLDYFGAICIYELFSFSVVDCAQQGFLMSKRALEYANKKKCVTLYVASAKMFSRGDTLYLEYPERGRN